MPGTARRDEVAEVDRQAGVQRFLAAAFLPESTAKTRCCFAAHSRFQNTFSEFFSNFFSVFRKPLQLSFLSEPAGLSGLRV